MLESIRKGDKIITAGGIHGLVEGLDRKFNARKDLQIT
ncbi:MAG: preprotein translocase subunit YajC [Ignavibacteria bacterium]|nr:preprotein translocase subunit YajC [Ignavibacteria bacterium]